MKPVMRKHRGAYAAPLALLLFVLPVRADDGPTVDFAIENGWVTLRLHKGDTPVTDARIVVLVGDGLWAEGETDAQGKGTFPRPMAEACQVVFVYTTGSSAPVPLTFSADKLTPATAAVGGAKPPCCLVSPVESSPPDGGSGQTASPWVLFGVALAFTGAVAFLAYRWAVGGKA